MFSFITSYYEGSVMIGLFSLRLFSPRAPGSATRSGALFQGLFPHDTFYVS